MGPGEMCSDVVSSKSSRVGVWGDVITSDFVGMKRGDEFLDVNQYSKAVRDLKEREILHLTLPDKQKPLQGSYTPIRFLKREPYPSVLDKHCASAH